MKKETERLTVTAKGREGVNRHRETNRKQIQRELRCRDRDSQAQTERDQGMCWNDSFSLTNKSRLHLGNFYQDDEEEEIHSSNTI